MTSLTTSSPTSVAPPSLLPASLLTHPAPLLALFGDSIVKQYLSQSTQQLDHIIFACGPLGIITGVISAIRVAGATQLMAIIGRARESRAESETELMRYVFTCVGSNPRC